MHAIYGAGQGNRTPIIWVEAKDFTIKLDTH